MDSPVARPGRSPRRITVTLEPKASVTASMAPTAVLDEEGVHADPPVPLSP